MVNNAHLKEAPRDVYQRWDAPPSAPGGGGGWDAMPPEMSLGLWKGVMRILWIDLRELQVASPR